MESALDWHLDKARLEWQLELGADECIGDVPVNRFQKAPEPAAVPAVNQPEVIRQRAEPDAVEVARLAASSADDLPALRAAMDSYEHCELKRGARQLVFADGVPGSRLMILGEAPGREEDREGRPFVGRAGQLLDRMTQAIGLSRDAEDAAKGVYITNVMPWRPPQNRDPEAEEIAMMLPFVQRHIALAKPEVLLLVGNIACQAALGRRGILKLRGTWTEAFGLPAMPMTHPAYLLRQPAAKRMAWADLLSVAERMGLP